MDTRAFTIRFDDVEAAQADRYAGELIRQLADKASQAQVSRRPERANTQELGSVLVLILGTEAAIAVAKGIAAWLKSRPSAKLVLKKPDGTEVQFDGASSDATKIAQAAFHNS
jgi:hypothetical protein